MERKDLLNLVPDWWKPLLRYWLEELKEDWYDINNITYIKEKYWAMSIECNWWNDIISDIETASRYTCETCWKAGRIRYNLGWYKCLCDDHYSLIKNKTK